VSVWPLDNSQRGAADLVHRFQWVSPLMLSPHNPDVLYTELNACSSRPITAIHGPKSAEISRATTKASSSRGGPLTNDITSVEYYDTIFALAESPIKKGTLWAGTDDGLVHVTTDDGQHWSKVTPKMPEWSTVDLIDPSPHDGNTAYVAVDRHKLDDFKPYIFKTTDLGKTWTAITSGIPDGSYVHAVREDPKQRGLLYAGTETGVFVSFDDGVRWQSLQLNLPVSPIHDLVVKDDDLVVATHGRSFWVLDDLTPIRQLTKQLLTTDVPLPAADGTALALPNGIRSASASR
jgi:ligand-binding sensor domain-containing protein